MGGRRKSKYDIHVQVDPTLSFDDLLKLSMGMEIQRTRRVFFKGNLAGMTKIVIDILDPNIDFENNPTEVSLWVCDNKIREFNSRDYVQQKEYRQKTVLNIPLSKDMKTLEIRIAPMKDYDVVKLRVFASNNDGSQTAFPAQT